MEVRHASHYDDVKRYDTEQLRHHFLIEDLFIEGNLKIVYSHIDRIIVAGAVPVGYPIFLEGSKELGCEYFLERREAGILNIGGTGIVTVDGVKYELESREGIYIGMGAKEVFFESIDAWNPAKFYINSAVAHKSYPTLKITLNMANQVKLGSDLDCNKRTIHQYIHSAVCQSCQLVMGITTLEPGSNWNTMPSHTHDRRMEVYLYIDVDKENVVFHFMGQPQETRHIVVQNEQAVISPSWSIHSGVGTKNYSFVWGMVGENQTFNDMDAVETKFLR